MSAVTISTYNGWYKDQFLEYEDLVPDHAPMSADFKFTLRKTGENMNFPVRVSREQGITWAGTSGGVVTLNTPIAGVTREVTVSPSEVYMQADIAYKAITSAGGTEQAFGEVVGEVVNDLHNSMYFYCELETLYGQSSIGTVESVAGTGTTEKVLTISKATFAPGALLGAERGHFDLFSTLGGSATNANGPLTITNINVDDRQITVTHDSADDTALDSAANDLLVPRSADGTWAAGVDKVLTNTGTLFGVSAATYPLWGAGSYGAGSAPLTFAKITNASITAGLRAGSTKRTCYVSPYTWSDLNNDHVQVTRLANKEGEIDWGFNTISYQGAGGRIDVKMHPCIKAGEALLLDLDTWHRIGSRDVSFRANDMGEDYFLNNLESKNAMRLRIMKDYAPVCSRPASNVKITGIVNSSL